jgi:hypothetical protein
MRVRVPPLALIATSDATWSSCSSEEKTMRFPSGAQAISVSETVPVLVTLRGREPSGRIVHASQTSPVRRWKAMRSPVGDQFGCRSSAAEVVQPGLGLVREALDVGTQSLPVLRIGKELVERDDGDALPPHLLEHSVQHGR